MQVEIGNMTKGRGKINNMANKPVEFKTKLFHEGKVYLKISDVSKALGYSKQQEFVNEYSHLIEKISGIQCVGETDFNDLLSENETALQKQGQIEVTKIETLRNKIDSVISLQGLKLLLARDFLQMMADRTGCSSKEEYLILHEIPEEKRKALTELVQKNETSKKYYMDMIDYLNDKEKFDIDKVRSFGLNVQYLTCIESDGRLDLNAYVVGQGVFHRITDLGDYELWNDMYVDGNGDIILPYYNYDYQKENLINISNVKIDRDFSKYNAIENMIWCINYLDVEAMEDYEMSVFSMHVDTIKFDMPLELLIKVIKPNAVSTIYTDRLIDLGTGMYMTEFNSEKVFMEDFSY